MSTPFAWHNGRIEPWADASVHVSTHALHYGSSMFEGERVYATPLGPAYFRLAEHTCRLFGSARVYEMAADLGIAVEERELPRETLHPAGEVFMTGNAAEITPVRNAVIPDRKDREPTIHRRTPHQQPAAMGVSA